MRIDILTPTGIITGCLRLIVSVYTLASYSDVDKDRGTAGDETATITSVFLSGAFLELLMVFNFCVFT